MKEDSWNKFMNDKELSLHMASSIMRGFKGYRLQRELLREYDDKYFSNLRSVCKERNREFGKSFTTTLYPFWPEEPEIMTKTEQLIQVLDSNEEQILIRDLKELLDEMKRAAKCRQLESN